jgi:hypothetical protein
LPLGGIVIAERHEARGSEVDRILAEIDATVEMTRQVQRIFHRCDVGASPPPGV